MINKNAPVILIVDDDAQVLESLVELLSDDYFVLTARSGGAAIETARQRGDLAAVVMDIRMSGIDGIEAARQISNRRSDLPIIFHTAYPGEYDEDEIDEREQPFDYVVKGDPISRLTRSVRNAVETHRFRTDNSALIQLAEAQFGLIGRSRPMLETYRLIRKAAGNDNPVLITGETGTGKELVARAIHYSSPRRKRPLAVFPCSRKTTDLVESELFGHVRGSYTGSTEDRRGLFRYAEGGTLLLDELSELDPATQTKLLRPLDGGGIKPVGADEVEPCDVRVLCATNKDLEVAVREGMFRADRYYRVAGIGISLVPLRERREDIPLLVKHVVDRFTVERGSPPKIVEDAAMDRLVEHEWPGNVRELLHVVRTLVDLTDSDLVGADDVTDRIRTETGIGNDTGRTLGERVREFERCQIIEALHATEYNISAAARLLGIDRAYLRRKIDGHDIDPTSFRD